MRTAELNESSNRRTEIVLAIVSPVGANVDEVCEVITDTLEQVVGYEAVTIRISELIDASLTQWPAKVDEVSRIRRLMDMGDTLRSSVKDGGVCAMLGVQAIRQIREDETKVRVAGATILRTLKHPGEVELLRRVYGQRLVVIGVSDSLETRHEDLRKHLRGSDKSAEAEARAAGEAAALIRRDEKDEASEFGQRVRDAYAQCDVYLPARGGRLRDAATRLVHLLFGKPFVTPSRDEMAIWQAYGAMFRSSAAGRQVGAVIVDVDGELLVAGCNDVPVPGGGQNWDGDSQDYRDFARGADANDSRKFALASELLVELQRAGWLNETLDGSDGDKLAELALAGKDGPLSRTRVADLLEFGRIMHAEMAALMTAARRGTPVRGAALYTTTYPCHECMRLIIGAGIKRVVYVDPYPKSLVPDLYGDHLRSSADGPAVQLEPFEGVAPRLVPRVFGYMKARKRDMKGSYEKWSGKSAGFVGSEERYTDTTIFQEVMVGDVLGEYMPTLTTLNGVAQS